MARSGIKNSVCFPALVAGGILDIGPVARLRSIFSLFALIVNVSPLQMNLWPDEDEIIDYMNARMWLD